MIHIVDLQTMTEIDRSTLQARFPGTSFPSIEHLTNAVLAHFGCATFTIDPQPAYSPFTTLAPGPISKNSDGTYSLHWIQTDASLDQMRQSLLNVVQQRYNTALQTTVRYGGQYDFSLNWQTVVLLRESAAANQSARIADNQGNWIELKPANATVLANSISSGLLSVNSNMYSHVNAIKALADTASAKAYDVTTGWPA